MRHRGIIIAGTALGIVLVLGGSAVAQTPPPKKCQTPLAAITCNGIVQGVLSTVGGVASGNPGLIAGGSIQLGTTAQAGWMRGTIGLFTGNAAGAISSAAGAIVRELDGATIPKSFPSWFMDSWGVTRNLGFQILFLCYVIAVIAGVLKANLARVAQTPLLAAAVVGGMFLTLVFVSVAVQTVDWASLQIMHGTTTNVDAVIQSFGVMLNVAAVAGPGANMLLGIGAMLLTLTAFAIVYFNLLIRKWIIYIAAGVLGLALSGSLTKAGAKWTKFLVGLLGTIIASKLLLVVILSYGVAALAKPSNLSDVAGGASVFLISGLSPWLLVGIVGVGSIRALHGGVHAAGEPLRMARRAGASARRSHNHWQSFRRQSVQPSPAQKAWTKANAPKKASGAAASKGAAGAGAAAGAATAGATVVAGAAKKAASGARRAPAKVAGPPPPPGTTQHPSGLIVLGSGGAAAARAAAGPRPSPSRPPQPTSKLIVPSSTKGPKP